MSITKSYQLPGTVKSPKLTLFSAELRNKPGLEVEPSGDLGPNPPVACTVPVPSRPGASPLTAAAPRSRYRSRDVQHQTHDAKHPTESLEKGAPASTKPRIDMDRPWTDIDSQLDSQVRLISFLTLSQSRHDVGEGGENHELKHKTVGNKALLLSPHRSLISAASGNLGRWQPAIHQQSDHRDPICGHARLAHGCEEAWRIETSVKLKGHPPKTVQYRQCISPVLHN